MAVRRLGIYFGKEKISIVEVLGTHITEAFCLPLAGINLTDKSQDALNEGLPIVSDEIQLVAKIKASIRDRRIQARKACLGLANKDQFIRGFQMLLLSSTFLLKPRICSLIINGVLIKNLQRWIFYLLPQQKIA